MRQYVSTRQTSLLHMLSHLPQPFEVARRFLERTATTMENTKVQVHIVSKTDCSESHLVSTDLSLLPPLAANNIRLQVRMVSLTANNLTYARHAAVANWWDAFPVPNFLPSPCNDENTYGIVPVWGFAETIASRTAGLQTGSIVYGFWPSSTLPVDLQLESTQPVGHYIDTTPHRQSMWSYYHRYTLVPNILDFSSPSLAAELVFKPLFECSHSLNSHVLGPLALHPSQGNIPWPSHADLSSTMVISLSASGKTARAFNDSILNARKPPGLKTPTSLHSNHQQPRNPHPANPTKLPIRNKTPLLHHSPLNPNPPQLPELPHPARLANPHSRLRRPRQQSRPSRLSPTLPSPTRYDGQSNSRRHRRRTNSIFLLQSRADSEQFRRCSRARADEH